MNFEKALYHCNLGNTLQELARTDESIASHQKALSLSPNLSESHNSLGDILLEQDRFEDAVACFDQAIIANPGYAEAHANRGSRSGTWGPTRMPPKASKGPRHQAQLRRGPTQPGHDAQKTGASG